MAQSTPQNFQNHTRFVPAYHMVLFGILMINLGWSVYQVFHAFSMQLSFHCFWLWVCSCWLSLRASSR